MAAPGSAQEFLTVVEKSGLLQATELDQYRFRSSADPSPPDRVAKWMLMDGRLTQFQAGLLLAGKTRPFFIGAYKVLSRIGNGSMGVVYLCEHTGMRRNVALKVLQNRRVQDQVALERFLREARAAAALDHPNVVHALDFGCEKQTYYLAMEHVDGKSLKELILTEGPLPPTKAANYLRQAALGVQHAHEAGLIHRDIKPSNLMIGKSGVVKLLDLGLARFGEEEIDLTRGATLGTVAYTAPEQALDSHSVDARADIYSLGATFYLAVTGRPPLTGIGSRDQAPPVGTDAAEFSRFMAVLRKMTAPNPAERYQTAAEVAVEMSGWNEPAAPDPVEIPEGEPEPSESLDSTLVDTGGVTTIESDAVVSLYMSPDDNEGAEKTSFSSFAQDPPPPPKPPKRTFPRPAPPPKTRPTRVQEDEGETERSWLTQHWKPLVLGLAVMVGLIAAIANHEWSASSTPTSYEIRRPANYEIRRIENSNKP